MTSVAPLTVGLDTKFTAIRLSRDKSRGIKEFRQNGADQTQLLFSVFSSPFGSCNSNWAKMCHLCVLTSVKMYRDRGSEGWPSQNRTTKIWRMSAAVVKTSTNCCWMRNFWGRRTRLKDSFTVAG